MAATKHCLLVVLLYAIPAAAGMTVFHTNCTRPPSDSGFNLVAAPDTRGTLEILWSCVSTLVLCTWQLQHIAVPPVNRDVDTPINEQLFWTLITMFAPEILITIPLLEFFRANKSVELMQSKLPDLVKQGGWTLPHAFFANMYGFMVRTGAAGDPDNAASDTGSENAGSETAPLVYRPFAMEDAKLLVLDAKRMIDYMESLPSPVLITKKYILRRAKEDILLKCIAGLQVTWFVVQLFVRKWHNLPATHLELSVLAFAICTLPIHLLWLKKPKGVSTPIILCEDHQLAHSDYWFDDRESLWGYQLDDTSFDSEMVDILVSYTTVVVGIIWGAFHLLAWNFRFLTHTEKILWRTSATAITAAPLFIVLGKLIHPSDDCDDFDKMPLTWVCGGIYILSRLFILVETFRSLAYQPPEAFATTWSTYLPHVS